MASKLYFSMVLFWEGLHKTNKLSKNDSTGKYHNQFIYDPIMVCWTNL